MLLCCRGVVDIPAEQDITLGGAWRRA